MPQPVEIRDIRGIEEVRSVEELQKKIWGMSDLDILPSTMLLASVEVGGVLIGAFVEGVLAGFAFAFPGIEDGNLTLHSDMLGVDPGFRNLDLGYRLKLAQRERALRLGISQITWTFDPLQSLNAYFNFAKLGVISSSYKTNFYGETSSFLHTLGTDRLWVVWLLQSHRVSARLNNVMNLKRPTVESQYVKILEIGENALPISNDSVTLTEGHLLIEIPGDIKSIENDDLELAVTWRDETRKAFTAALAAGYLVEEFFRIQKNSLSTGAYLLSRGKSISDFI